MRWIPGISYSGETARDSVWSGWLLGSRQTTVCTDCKEPWSGESFRYSCGRSIDPDPEHLPHRQSSFKTSAFRTTEAKKDTGSTIGKCILHLVPRKRRTNSGIFRDCKRNPLLSKSRKVFENVFNGSSNSSRQQPGWTSDQAILCWKEKLEAHRHCPRSKSQRHSLQPRRNRKSKQFEYLSVFPISFKWDSEAYGWYES